MKFYSTLNREKTYSLEEAAVLGLAPDGGLFMPQYIPQVNLPEIFRLSQLSFADMAANIAYLFFKEDMTELQIDEAICKALSFDIPLVKVGEEDNGNTPLYTLELFHGPTCAFKDVGASCMGQVLGILNSRKAPAPNGEQEKKPLIILTATSGDTGSAVAKGFYNIEGIGVTVLFPDGKVSPLQECQMTALGKNIRAVKVKGTFDDCQRLVKGIFNNRKLREEINVTSANSINLLRWLPQCFYYFYAYCKWVALEHPKILKQISGGSAEYCKNGDIAMPKVTFVVPSGNYGNLAAGILAKKMGLPVKGFVAASNSNDVFPQYLKTGVYEPKASIQTIANAMDVGAPSNFERILALYDNDYEAICKDIQGFSCNDVQIREAIGELYRKYSYMSCPHSAVGYLAAKENHGDGNTIWLSTASPAKFSEVITPVTGTAPHIPERLRELLEKEKHSETIEVSLAALETLLKQDGQTYR